MHKPPDSLEKGWKVHRDAYNELLDYVIKTRPVIAHGHTETSNGTMPPPQPAKVTQQFTPLLTGDPLELSLYPGYVYAPYDNGNAETTVMIQQWPYEPKIGSTLLTAEDTPTLSLTKSSTNYVYLKLKWLKIEQDIGGSLYTSGGSGTGYAFRANYNLVDSVPGAVADGSGYDTGIHVQVKKLNYYLSEATFEVNTNETPPTEQVLTSDIYTYLLAGHITLNANGKLADDGDTEAIRWFMNGPVFANKPAEYIGVEDQDRTEPGEPGASTGETIPGHA